jgi:hypothetical protein
MQNVATPTNSARFLCDAVDSSESSEDRADATPSTSSSNKTPSTHLVMRHYQHRFITHQSKDVTLG